MIVQLTETATKKIESLCKEEGKYAVSLNVKGGGCAGFEYDWGFVDLEEVRDLDEIIKTENGNLVIGQESIMFLFGSILDYKDSKFGAMFTIENPSASSSCGCGTSFSYDVDSMDP